MREGEGGRGSQIGGLLVGIGLPIILVQVLDGVALAITVGIAVLLGLALMVEPVAPWLLPVRVEHDERGRYFRTQRPRLSAERRPRLSELRSRANAFEQGVMNLCAEADAVDWPEKSKVVTRYHSEFGAEGAYLAGQFERLGMANEEDRFMFEHPTNPLGLRQVATRAGEWSRQLR